MYTVNETPCTPQERAAQLLRRYHKPLLAVLLLLAYLPLRYFVATQVAAADTAVDAQSTMAQVSSQFVGMWLPFSKLVWAVIFFYASGFFSFAGLKVSPVLPDWAKGHYSNSKPGSLPAPVLDYKAAFLAQTDAERLAHYERAAWKEMIRFGICLLAACLVV
jgi:hypothetical protein